MGAAVGDVGEHALAHGSAVDALGNGGELGEPSALKGAEQAC